MQMYFFLKCRCCTPAFDLPHMKKTGRGVEFSLHKEARDVTPHSICEFPDFQWLFSRVRYWEIIRLLALDKYDLRYPRASESKWSYFLLRRRRCKARWELWLIRFHTIPRISPTPITRVRGIVLLYESRGWCSVTFRLQAISGCSTAGCVIEVIRTVRLGSHEETWVSPEIETWPLIVGITNGIRTNITSGNDRSETWYSVVIIQS